MLLGLEELTEILSVLILLLDLFLEAFLRLSVVFDVFVADDDVDKLFISS